MSEWVIDAMEAALRDMGAKPLPRRMQRHPHIFTTADGERFRVASDGTHVAIPRPSDVPLPVNTHRNAREQCQDTTSGARTRAPSENSHSPLRPTKRVSSADESTDHHAEPAGTSTRRSLAVDGSESSHDRLGRLVAELRGSIRDCGAILQRIESG